jgi:hypothetical protein
MENWQWQLDHAKMAGTVLEAEATGGASQALTADAKPWIQHPFWRWCPLRHLHASACMCYIMKHEPNESDESNIYCGVCIRVHASRILMLEEGLQTQGLAACRGQCEMQTLLQSLRARYHKKWDTACTGTK